MIETTGGTTGLRDPGMLEAIIAKPAASFGGEDLYPDIYSKAAALFEAVVNYHVFVDGNKRTAVAALGLFLSQNGYDLVTSNDKLISFAVTTANGHPDLADVAAWIRSNSHEVNS